jgi:uncharacterized protein YkwD
VTFPKPWIWIFVLLSLTACTLAQTFVPAPSATVQAYSTYVVQQGDTLSRIATRFHVTIEQLIDANSDTYPDLARDPSTLQPGWKLRVPTPSADAATAAAESPQVDLSLAAKRIVDQINSARAQKGMLLLRTDVTLTRIAGDRSSDMITRNYFSHYDPQTGQEPLLRYLQATNYTYEYAGENIAEIKNDAGWVPPWLTVAARYSADDLANEFVKGWLASPEHRANIFNTHYHRTGVALAVSRDGHRIVATQAFSD